MSFSYENSLVNNIPSNEFFRLKFIKCIVFIYSLLSHKFSDCGGEIKVVSSTTLLSPRFPGDYGSNIDCGWRISVPEGKRVSITINSLTVSKLFGRCLDYLLFYDRSQPDNQYRKTK